MNILEEIRRAATAGIREYLRSTRGAHACGPGCQITEMESSLGTQLVISLANEKRIIIGFLED